MNQTKSEMPISSFTLNELITMAGGEKRPGIMGECIAANSDRKWRYSGSRAA